MKNESMENAINEGMMIHAMLLHLGATFSVSFMSTEAKLLMWWKSGLPEKVVEYGFEPEDSEGGHTWYASEIYPLTKIVICKR